jgi:hypothetical protein
MKKNTGGPFEKRVAGWLQTAVNSGTFGLNPQNVRIHQHHPLYSRDRNSKILFDVVLEVFRTNAASPYLTWLWECKDYTHTVPVDDIEEFHSKIEQVGRDNGKGTMISSAGFSQGVLYLAKSYGIGLMRVVSRCKPSGAKSQKASTVGDVVGQFGRGKDVISVLEEFPSERSRQRSREQAAELLNMLGSLLGVGAKEEPQPEPSRVIPPTHEQLLLGADAQEACYVYQSPGGAICHRETWQQIDATLAGQTAK